MHLVDQFLASYGYFAVFGLLMLGIVGPLIPDETILVLAGIAIHRGQMNPLVTFAVATAGSLCGITLSYLLGRNGVVCALRHFPPLQRHVGKYLPEAHRWFESFGKWTLFFGYFIAGVRHFTALVAGTSELPPATFALYAYSGGTVWVACFLTIGYYLGEGWENKAQRIDRTILLATAAIAVIAAIWWYLKKRAKADAQRKMDPRR
jgi:membrane protein DedA with SNARE-associated domain